MNESTLPQQVSIVESVGPAELITNELDEIVHAFVSEPGKGGDKDALGTLLANLLQHRLNGRHQSSPRIARTGRFSHRELPTKAITT